MHSNHNEASLSHLNHLGLVHRPRNYYGSLLWLLRTHNLDHPSPRSYVFDSGISAFSVARRSPALVKGPMLSYLETRALAMDGPVTWSIKGDL